MAERFAMIEGLLMAQGYSCERALRKDTGFYFLTHAKTGDLPFGVGIRNGHLEIIRFSRLDHQDGCVTILSITAEVGAIINAIELLARGAMIAA